MPKFEGKNVGPETEDCTDILNIFCILMQKYISGHSRKGKIECESRRSTFKTSVQFSVAHYYQQQFESNPNRAHLGCCLNSSLTGITTCYQFCKQLEQMRGQGSQIRVNSLPNLTTGLSFKVPPCTYFLRTM